MTEETVGETTEQPLADVEQSQQAVNTDSEAGSEQAAETVVEPTNKTPAWVEKRFSEMTKARHDAQREAEAARGEADTYKRLVEALQRGDTPEPAKPRTETQGNDETRIREAATQLHALETFNARCNSVYETGKAELPGFEESVKNLGMLGVSQDFIAAVVGLDDAHKVLNALGSNPDEAARIFALPALQQGRELERLSSKGPAKGGKPVSNAPDPINTRLDTGKPQGKNLDNMSIDDFMAARNSQSKR